MPQGRAGDLPARRGATTLESDTLIDRDLERHRNALEEAVRRFLSIEHRKLLSSGAVDGLDDDRVVLAGDSEYENAVVYAPPEQKHFWERKAHDVALPSFFPSGTP